MIPQCIELENFLSFGEKQAIAFAEGEPLWVLAGPNGVGKSAVFDAVTYALFGQHRGGKNLAHHLIRHGANGLCVAFTFTVGEATYRITRSKTRAKTGSTTQKLERQIEGTDWEPVPNVNDNDDLEAWVERTLGINFAAFVSSVLLQQGNADVVIEAKGAERFKLLRSIVGADRYQALGDRVRESTKRAKIRLDDAREVRDRAPPIPENALATATTAVDEAEALWGTTQTAVESALAAVPVAEQWERLSQEQTQLAAFFAEADALAADADRIRTAHARWESLTAAVPLLQAFVDAGRALESATARAAEVQAKRDGLAREVAQLATERDAAANALAEACAAVDRQAAESTRLRAEMGRDEKFLKQARSLAEAEVRLATFPIDLDASRATADDELAASVAAHADASAESARLAGLLDRARDEQTAFADVSIGVDCSRCGQKVTAEHADRERQRLADEVRDLEAKLGGAKATAEAARARKLEAEQTAQRLRSAGLARDTAARDAAQIREALTAHGATPDAVMLESELAEKRDRADTADRERVAAEARQAGHAGEFDRLRRSHHDAVATLESTAVLLASANQSNAVATDRLVTATRGVPAPWSLAPAEVTASVVENLIEERNSLEAAGTAETMKQLDAATQRRSLMEERAATVAAELERIPAIARQSVSAAQAALTAARDHQFLADRERTAARDHLADLRRRAENWAAATAAVAAAERAHGLHAKLDALLGPDGLQRELVRDAESQIVRHAHAIAQNLSNRDLSIELDEQGKDDALTLRVRRMSSADAIPVKFLSGSQKFRVAVAVALGIGAFAGGRSRPLDSVIIDEGFGSLDRDGLDATYEELNRLKGYLKRIVLVSHQEEFAGRFPVGYRLTPGDTGTTAERFRR